MSDILALNSDGVTAPSLEFKLPDDLQNSPPLGLGVGWYPNDSQAAKLAKDSTARTAQVVNDAMSDWKSFRSTVFLYKLKTEAEGYTHHEMQPFSRSFAGRDWMFVHNGHLDRDGLAKLHTNDSGFLEPLGKTDSEIAFCFLLSMMHEEHVRKISEVSPQRLLSWFEKLDALGSANIILSDGISMVYFHGTQSPDQLYYSRLKPPNRDTCLDSSGATLQINDPRDTYRTSLVVTSIQFDHHDMSAMQSGQLMVARRGNILWNSLTSQINVNKSPPKKNVVPEPSSTHIAQNNESPFIHIRSLSCHPDGSALSFRLFDITHTTTYTYAESIEHSTHKFRLLPEDDHVQEVMHASIAISVEGEEVQYEDVFGNQSIYYSINIPYDSLVVESKSQIKIYSCPPDDHSLARRQTSMPLVWMPWQQQMMMPYLLPVELPETQLEELTLYAMSFVERNDYHLLETLKDMNLSIYRDYQYEQKQTSLKTTPFEVYSTRIGVCQDFANLLICMARLLGVPARYRMGYIYTGADYENTIQSEASHAWIEVYLPYVGWRGFDPTNGCMVSQEHIRVACGRNYRDATPTSGTIFKGGGKEQMVVDVKIEEL